MKYPFNKKLFLAAASNSLSSSAPLPILLMVESTDLPNLGLSTNLETTFSSLLIFEVNFFRSSEGYPKVRNRTMGERGEKTD